MYAQTTHREGSSTRLLGEGGEDGWFIKALNSAFRMSVEVRHAGFAPKASQCDKGRRLRLPVL
jgi:hypothetical protein